jgi:hypothetical protein
VKRILLIPVVGTILALVAITLAREPRGPQKDEEQTPMDMGEAPEHAPPPDEQEGEEPAPPEEGEAEPEPAPEPQEIQLELESDGSLVELGVLPPMEPHRFASIDDLVKQLTKARHTIVLANGKGVTKEALDEAEVRLRDQFNVRKVYRAPEETPKGK